MVHSERHRLERKILQRYCRVEPLDRDRFEARHAPSLAMTPLEELDEVWKRHLATKPESAPRIRRFGEKYWDDIPWHGEAEMWRDNVIGKLQGEEVQI